jgi:predicted kinase
MDEYPMHPTVETVLGTTPAWTSAELVAAMAGQSEGVTTELAAGFASWDIDASASFDAGTLLAAARCELERGGGYYLRCEHLLLGMLRVLGAEDALESARSDFQRLKGERASGEYRKLRSLPGPGGAPRPCAIVVGGVPGTGKSTLAEALARELRAPVFSMDWQMGALVPFGVLRKDNLEPLSELMVAASMARQLQLGLDTILDIVALRAGERRRLSEIAGALDAAFIEVECQCSDGQVHRSRVEGRARGIPGWPGTVTWEHVQRMRERWEPWPEPHLVVDSAVEPPDKVLRRVLAAVHVER